MESLVKRVGLRLNGSHTALSNSEVSSVLAPSSIFAIFFPRAFFFAGSTARAKAARLGARSREEAKSLRRGRRGRRVGPQTSAGQPSA